MNRNDNRKGAWLENQVAAILRKKLGARVQRDKRSGAGPTNRADISDYYQEIPLHLEVKNQETVKVKEWFRQADDAASVGQAPTVVFAMDDELLTIIRFSDLVNFMVEIADQKAEIDDLRAPVVMGYDPGQKDGDYSATVTGRKNKDGSVTITDVKTEPVVQFKGKKQPLSKAVKAAQEQKTVMCRGGHIADSYGYCQQLTCKYSRGYRPPKGKAKR